MKKVVCEKQTIVIDVENVDKNKIYAMIGCNRNLYKLHRYDDMYRFISLKDSSSWGAYESEDIVKCITKCITKYGYSVYEFDNQREFAQWILDNAND